MAVEELEQAITVTRGVLAGVSKDQLGEDTPCAAWKVNGLINHIVGAQYFFTASVNGAAPATEEIDYASGDFVATFDEASQQTLMAFGADGAMEKMLTLPFGQMPGAAFIGIATTDTFTHAWDLAKATGQNTDLNPALAAQLLEASKQMIRPEFRSDDGAVFGPEQPAPAGASSADQLAAFLGRSV